MKRIAILVTGTRNATASLAKNVHGQLSMYPRENMLVIHGDAKGADAAASLWAKQNGVQEARFPADWKRGLRAGPERNQTMVDVLWALQEAGYDVAAEAFPAKDSRGTWDCVRRLQAAGIEPTITEV